MDHAFRSLPPEALELEVDERILITSREQPQPNDGNGREHIKPSQNGCSLCTPTASIPCQIYHQKAQHSQTDLSQILHLEAKTRHR